MIELRPHKGMVAIPGRPPKEVDIGQDRIFFNGICVGIIGRRPGAEVMITGHASESELSQIRAYVNEVRGEELAERKVHTAPKIRPEDEPENEDLLDDE